MFTFPLGLLKKTGPAGSDHNIYQGATPGSIQTTAGEFGVRFFIDEDNCTAKGVRFWKDAAEGGTHTGRLWSDAGSSLATVIFTGETASGWQTMNFASPVALTKNTWYVVSVNQTVKYGYNSTVFPKKYNPFHMISSSACFNVTQGSFPASGADITNGYAVEPLVHSLLLGTNNSFYNTFIANTAVDDTPQNSAAAPNLTVGTIFQVPGSTRTTS